MHTLGDYRLSDLSTLPTLAPGRVPDYSEQTVQVTTEVNVCSPDLNFPNNSLSRESLFFRVLFSFDLDLCVTAGSRLTRLIVNLSPNSNPDIYHGLISVQILVQQNWNIIEVTPNLTHRQFNIPPRNVFIWIAAATVLCVVEMSLCVSPARL